LGIVKGEGTSLNISVRDRQLTGSQVSFQLADPSKITQQRKDNWTGTKEKI